MQLIQKLLLHVPPKGVHTARYYGLYAAALNVKPLHYATFLTYDCCKGWPY